MVLTVTAGKIKATREVRILDPILAGLETLREITGGKNDDRIVPSATGGPWTQSKFRNWRSRKWKVARTKAKLGDQPPYALRRGYASLLLHTGKPLHYVARQVGNGARILSKTYAHILDAREKVRNEQSRRSQPRRQQLL